MDPRRQQHTIGGKRSRSPAELGNQQGPAKHPSHARVRNGSIPPASPDPGDDSSRAFTPEATSESDAGFVDVPTARQQQHRLARGGRQHGATGRLREAAVCGVLWHPECQDLCTASQPSADGRTAAIPLSFRSPEHYVGMFEPLLHDEARSGLLNAFDDIRGATAWDLPTRGWRVNVSNVSQEPGDWFTATIAPATGGNQSRGRHQQPERLRADNVVVLSKVVVDKASTEAVAQPGPNDPRKLLQVAAIVKQASAGNYDPVKLELHPACPGHDSNDWQAPCMQAMQEMLAHGHGWMVTPMGSLITNERECETLARVAQGASGPMKTLLPMLLDPVTAAESCRGKLAQVWPADFTNPELMSQFGAWLAETYDLPQREAIQICSSHLALEHQLSTSPVPVLPFTLIQGPPGTGKTHTVKGILNVWHVIKYRRFHDVWRREAAKALLDLQARCSSWDREQRARAALSDLHLRLPDSASRPRVLVCAPSNAATDELCERILKEGFRDLNMNVTFPDVARVGSEDAAMSDAVKDVWIEARVKFYMSMNQHAFAMEFRKAEAKQTHAQQAMSALLSKLDHYATRGEEGMMELAGMLVDIQTQHTRAEIDMTRLGIVAPLHAPGKHIHEWKMREDLELSCMEAAELVFTTLSSTGRQVFSRFKKPFDAVLIDEACQAAEIAALQPLIHGTTKVVLVGDPKQLPATLFSRTAKETAMERSLFERMAQAGVPVKLLAVQYRMHPEIRAFPSAFFYDNQLQDAPQVINMPPAPFYHSDLLKPYVVFDVQHGREGAGHGGRSKCNAAEARFAAGLFWELRCVMMEAVKAAQSDPARPVVPKIEVGIVTPYRSQRDLIRNMFTELLGPQVLNDVRIETVDSFQGKQLDVIILSCVRAFAGSNTGASTIGFLSDVRRLNVAITRAKRALWIIGHMQSLQQHRVWKALIQDAETRGCLVHDANADDPMLLPQFSELMTNIQAQKQRQLAAEQQQQQQAGGSQQQQQQWPSKPPGPPQPNGGQDGLPDQARRRDPRGMRANTPPAGLPGPSAAASQPAPLQPQRPAGQQDPRLQQRRSQTPPNVINNAAPPEAGNIPVPLPNVLPQQAMGAYVRPPQGFVAQPPPAQAAYADDWLHDDSSMVSSNSIQYHGHVTAYQPPQPPPQGQGVPFPTQATVVQPAGLPSNTAQQGGFAGYAAGGLVAGLVGQGAPYNGQTLGLHNQGMPTDPRRIAR